MAWTRLSTRDPGSSHWLLVRVGVPWPSAVLAGVLDSVVSCPASWSCGRLVHWALTELTPRSVAGSYKPPRPGELLLQCRAQSPGMLPGAQVASDLGCSRDSSTRWLPVRLPWVCVKGFRAGQRSSIM